MWKGWMAALMVALLFTGCSERQALSPMPAGLTAPASPEIQSKLDRNQLVQTGMGNVARVLTRSPETGAPAADPFIELAAGSTGRQEYFQDIAADKADFAAIHAKFLANSGYACVSLSALDGAGRPVATVSYLYSGKLPAEDRRHKWIDRRFSCNYAGRWVQEYYPINDILRGYFPATTLVGVETFRMSIVVADGQHAIFDSFFTGFDRSWAVKLLPERLRLDAQKGDSLTVGTQIENISDKSVSGLKVTMVLPPAYGLVAEGPVEMTVDNLSPGEKRRLEWKVKAQRPSEVNGGKPWELSFALDGAQKRETAIQIAVADPRPGKIFYVMTEDLEPIDSAGYREAWGNANSWLDPEEFSTQLVKKPNRLNQIAGKYGAKWTHYLAWPAVEGAEWAARQSKKQDWTNVIAAIKDSVRAGRQQGHEYAVHTHTDYDPYLPTNVLSYNPAVDGFWANHLQHGWAHNFPVEGDFSQRVSRVGSLYDYQRSLDELTAVYGQTLTTRAGSYDVGFTPADEAMSIRAYRKVGLWGSSEAGGNIGQNASAEYGHEIYFCQPDSVNKPAERFDRIGLVEFLPTPGQKICYDTDSAAVMDEKVRGGMDVFVKKGQVLPGVHGIIGFTHAIFMQGDGDWRSLDGGQFAALDEHLAFLRQQYVDKGQLSFATASEMVAAYLDYYTPEPVAIYGKSNRSAYGRSEYDITILGQDIPIDAAHPHQVKVKYPLNLRDETYYVTIQKNGQEICAVKNLPTPDNDIEFTVNDANAVYTMQIYHSATLHQWLVNWPQTKERLMRLLDMVCRKASV